jgi:cyclopropane-fatty-acyl-phospholipid synthase
VSVAELRQPPPPRGGALAHVAFRILDSVLPRLEGGTLVVGDRRYGTGPEVRMHVHSTRLLQRIATRGAIGLGESYVAGDWDADDLPALLGLLLANAEAGVERHPRLHRLTTARPRLRRRNGLLRARRNIAYHYDLGNDLYALMLDETMTYSCAIFEASDSLEDAQLRKLRAICDKLELGPGSHVLEIGCGWGSFAEVAARDYGARVAGWPGSTSRSSSRTTACTRAGTRTSPRSRCSRRSATTSGRPTSRRSTACSRRAAVPSCRRS